MPSCLFGRSLRATAVQRDGLIYGTEQMSISSDSVVQIQIHMLQCGSLEGAPRHIMCRQEHNSISSADPYRC